jgi:restriction system protein
MNTNPLDTVLASLTPLLWKLLLIMVALAAARFIIEVLLPDLFHHWMVKLRFRKGERWRNERQLLSWLRGMRPSEFEQYVADLFTRMGFAARAVGGSRDRGVDVEATKDGVTHFIQCKKFITSQVGVRDVRDFYGAIADRLARGKGYFITTNKFTLEAERYAEDKPIELIDGMRLLKYIRDVMPGTATTGTAGPSAQAGVATERTCPRCGGMLVERAGKYGPFLGCSNYPRCRQTLPL